MNYSPLYMTQEAIQQVLKDIERNLDFLSYDELWTLASDLACLDLRARMRATRLLREGREK